MNGEINWPKSTYLTYNKMNSILKAGPVWDFDWAILTLWDNFEIKDALYYDALFKNQAFIDTVTSAWTMAGLSVTEINEEIQTLHDEIYIAQAVDTLKWGIHMDPSEIQRTDFDAYVNFVKTSLDSRIEWINNNLPK